MTYDITRELPTVTNIPGTVPGWMELAATALGNARTKKLGRKYGLEKWDDGIATANPKVTFPLVLWERQYGRSTKYFSLVDKRKIEGGFLLTIFSEAKQPNHTAVQAIAVNDQRVPYRGLRRIINDDYADTVAATLIDSLQACTILEEVDQKPDDVQLRAFARIVSTALTPAS